MKHIPLHIKIVTGLKIRKLTAVEVARLLGVSRAAVSSWCRGREIPGVHASLDLITIFNRTEIVEKISYENRYTLTINDIITEKLRHKQRLLEQQVSTLPKHRKPPKNQPKYIPTKLRKKKPKTTRKKKPSKG